jgi:CMP-N-acetylneuraminic acid synthetase
LKTLAIIPARGGSKQIPQKNMRILGTLPLIQHILGAVSGANVFDDLVVATDSDCIQRLALEMGFDVFKRSSNSSSDDATIDDVVVEYLNSVDVEKYRFIATFQVTSPLLKEGTIRQAFNAFSAGGFDTLISATESTHLEWSLLDGQFYPKYTNRVNRQQLPKSFRETGAFVFFKPALTLTSFTRINGKVGLEIVSEEESIDIDSDIDWLASEALLSRRKIMFRVLGSDTKGIGHVYNSLQIIDSLCGHELHITVTGDSYIAEEKFSELNYPCERLNHIKFLDKLSYVQPDLLILDCLDNNEEFVAEIKEKSNCKIVTFEDRGSGCDGVDLVVNAIYRPSKIAANEVNGYQYFLLRQEFLRTALDNYQGETVSTILLVFGGVDPNNLTRRVFEILLSEVSLSSIKIRIVLGIGYQHPKSI